MATKFYRWDAAEGLHTGEDCAMYFRACVEEDPGDGSLIRAALGDIARARGMTQLANETGLARESLYRALSADGNPEFSTILRVIHALGYALQAKPLARAPAKRKTRSVQPKRAAAR